MYHSTNKNINYSVEVNILPSEICDEEQCKIIARLMVLKEYNTIKIHVIETVEMCRDYCCTQHSLTHSQNVSSCHFVSDDVNGNLGKDKVIGHVSIWLTPHYKCQNILMTLIWDYDRITGPQYYDKNYKRNSRTIEISIKL